MRTSTARAASAALAAGLLLAACNGADGVESPNSPNPTPAAATPADPPAEEALDGGRAAELYVTWRETVYGLPPTPPEAIDVESAGERIVVPGSDAAAWVTEELELARERGVIIRGGVHAEPISPVEVAEDRATVAVCSSADVRITDVASGEPAADEPVDDSYTRFDVAYQLVEDDWLVERAEPSEDSGCVPPSIEQAVEARWNLFTEGWYERDRRGGGDDLGQLTDVVTDEFAEVLRGLPRRDPVPDPAPFTDFALVAATRTSATGHACRSEGLETVEWQLLDGQWRVDFVGQAGEEAVPCP